MAQLEKVQYTAKAHTTGGRDGASQEGPVTPNPLEFIYKAMNATASGKHDPENEQDLRDAIEQELLAINAALALERRHGVTMLPPQVQAHIAARRSFHASFFRHRVSECEGLLARRIAAERPWKQCGRKDGSLLESDSRY